MSPERNFHGKTYSQLPLYFSDHGYDWDVLWAGWLQWRRERQAELGLSRRKTA